MEPVLLELEEKARQTKGTAGPEAEREKAEQQRGKESQQISLKTGREQKGGPRKVTPPLWIYLVGSTRFLFFFLARCRGGTSRAVLQDKR